MFEASPSYGRNPVKTPFNFKSLTSADGGLLPKETLIRMFDLMMQVNSILSAIPKQWLVYLEKLKV